MLYVSDKTPCDMGMMLNVEFRVMGMRHKES